jgi:outer membrane receptor protein involved in Fe transport
VNNGESDDFINKAGPETRIIGCCTLGGIAILPVTQHDNTWQIADNLSFINGRHNVKVGVDLNRTSVSQIFRGNWRGLYIFTALENYVRVASHETNPMTGRPYPADFLRIFFGNGQFRGNFWDFGGFAQDSIRLNSRLNIYLGLRYEAAPMPEPPAPNPLLPLTETIPDDLKMWQPRVGLSWSPTGDGRTVVRLGGGIFHGRTPYLLVNQAFNSNGTPKRGCHV